MIFLISGLSRSGMTAICQNIAGQNNVPFHGEITPRFVPGVVPSDSDFKAANHETRFQPALTEEAFTNFFLDPAPGVYQCNWTGCYHMLPQAHALVLRADLRSVCLSQASLLARGNVPLDLQYVIQGLFTPLLMDAWALATLAKRMPSLPVIWYEDNFGPPSVNKYSAFEGLSFSEAAVDWLDSMLENSQAQKAVNDLRATRKSTPISQIKGRV